MAANMERKSANRMKARTEPGPVRFSGIGRDVKAQMPGNGRKSVSGFRDPGAKLLLKAEEMQAEQEDRGLNFPQPDGLRAWEPPTAFSVFF